MNYEPIQKRLNELGAAPPLLVDGKWGGKSKAALMAFQRAKGLVVDGIPGPASLAALGLAPAATQAPSATPPKGNNDDRNAYAIAKRAAPGMPEAQLQYALSVARGEGRYGLGWGVLPRDAVALEFMQKHGLTGTEGVGSNNWGAEQGSGDAGSFPHVDFGWRNPDGTPWNGKGPKAWLPYIGRYKRWSTPEKGFLSVANTVLGGGKRGAVGAKAIKDAIARGDLKAAVDAQHANGYFELNPADYFAAMQRNYQALTSATGWTALLGAAAVAGSGLLFFALTTAAGAAVWWYLRHKGSA